MALSLAPAIVHRLRGPASPFFQSQPHPNGDSPSARQARPNNRVRRVDGKQVSFHKLTPPGYSPTVHARARDSARYSSACSFYALITPPPPPGSRYRGATDAKAGGCGQKRRPIRSAVDTTPIGAAVARGSVSVSSVSGAKIMRLPQPQSGSGPAPPAVGRRSSSAMPQSRLAAPPHRGCFAANVISRVICHRFRYLGNTYNFLQFRLLRCYRRCGVCGFDSHLAQSLTCTLFLCYVTGAPDGWWSPTRPRASFPSTTCSGG